MKTILVLGAGRSSQALISYLLHHAGRQRWSVVVGDLSAEAAAARIGSSPAGRAIQFDMGDGEAVRRTIGAADVVVSMLPPRFHPRIAGICLEAGSHLFTASYVSDEMKAFDEEAKARGLLFLNECGLDPGIDHMSAMKIIDDVRVRGGALVSFESFAGGLIAPETDPDNPWRYKFTWNPMNVVTAGQGGARYLYDGRQKDISYQQLFGSLTPVQVPGYGAYEGYANRDSLKYIDTYGLQGIRTLIRGTLRCKGFCAAWNVLVQLGCCDDTYKMSHLDAMTHRGFIGSFLQQKDGRTAEEQLCRQLNLDAHCHELYCLRWSGLFSDEPVGLGEGSPARVLEHILNKKWKLDAADSDMIVMWHRIGYVQEGREKKIETSLVVKGEDARHTGMAKTVGLPLAISVKLLLQGKIQTRGVVIPIKKEIYGPVLDELAELGVRFEEREGDGDA